MNPLEKELKTLIKKDDAIFNFIEENALDGIFFWDLANRANGWHSVKFWEILGYTMQEVNKGLIKLEDIINEDDFILANKNYEAHIKNPEKYPFVHDLRHTHKNGATVWLRVRGTIIYNADKQPYRMLGTHTCITKQKEAELELNKKIQHYENVISGANMGSWECNLITTEVKYNERWAEIFGYTLKELAPITPTKWMSFIHPEDIEAANSAFESHMKGEVFAECEFRMKHKQGHWIWVLSRGRVMLEDLKGKPQIIAGSHYDITERKTNEQLLIKNSNLMQRINEAAEIGIWEVNLDINTVYWDSTIKKLMKVPEHYNPTLDDVIGFFKEGESRDTISKALENAIENGVNYDVDLQVVTTSNVVKWARTVGISEFENGVCKRLYGFFQDIDQKTRIANDLATKEEEFRQTFTYADIGMAVINADRTLRKANQSLCKILGYTELELQHMSFTDFVHPDDLELSRNTLIKLIQSKKTSYKIEHRCIHKKGHVIWVNASFSIVKNDNNRFIHIVVQVQDITENKKQQLLLKNSKDLLERSNKIGKIGSWEINPEDQSVFWSDTLIELMEEGVFTKHTLELSLTNYVYKKEEIENINAIFHEALTLGKKFDLEFQIQTKKNNIKWIRVIGESEFKNGKCIKLSGLAQDIDTQKRQQIEVALKEEEFKKTFTQAPIGMAIINLEGKITRVNPRLCEIIGYTEEEIKQTPIPNLSHPDDVKVSKKLLGELLQGKRDNFYLEKRYLHKNGQTVWTKVSSAAVVNEDDKISYVVSQIQDITERKKNQQQILDYKNLLERSNEVAKIGLWEVNLKTQDTFLSDNFIKLLAEDNYKKRNLNDFIANYILEKDQEKLEDIFNKAITQGKNFDFEIQINGRGSRLFWARLIGISEFKNGKCEKLYGLAQDIDDAKTTQLEIALREEEFRQTFTLATIGLVVINKKGKITQANNGFCSLLGYSKKEILNLTFKDITHPEDIPRTTQFHAELLAGKRENYNLEKRYLHKDGHVIWVKVTLSSISDDSGKLIHFLKQVQDITGIKKNQLLLEKYKKELEHSNRMAKIGSWEIDIQNKNAIFWSDTLKDILEAPTNVTPTLEGAINLYPVGPHRDSINQCIDRAIFHGENFDITIQIKTYSNQLKWVRAIGISEYQKGKCQRIYGLFQDVNEAKQAETEIALKEEQFRQTFWHANIGMTLLDLNGKITRANPSVCNTFGYPEEEFIKMPFSELTHPDDLELSHQLVLELAEGKRDSFQIEKRGIHKNGDVIWILLSTSSVKNDHGEVSHFVSQIQDITENKKLTESLKEHNNRLLNFAHIVSHNLRSHTGNITMLLNINEANNTNIIDNELYQHIKSASNNMNETVNYLTEIVEINSQVKNNLVPKNLSKSINKALQNVQSSISLHDIEVQVKVDKSIEVIVVPAYLDSIVFNLITNAIKYRSPDRVCKINISTSIARKFIHLQITDNGQGIDLEKHGNKLFGMYKTFHDHEDARGIGLFISKNQIEAMDGKIEVISKVDKGSTFKTYFKYEHNN